MNSEEIRKSPQSKFYVSKPIFDYILELPSSIISKKSGNKLILFCRLYHSSNRFIEDMRIWHVGYEAGNETFPQDNGIEDFNLNFALARLQESFKKNGYELHKIGYEYPEILSKEPKDD